MACLPVDSSRCDPLDLLLECGLGGSALQRQMAELVELALAVSDCPVAILGRVHEGQHWLEASAGIELPEEILGWLVNPPAHVPVAVEDTENSPDFAGRLLNGRPAIRAWAAAVILSADGTCLGRLGVGDTVPRAFTERQILSLTRLASQVAALIDLQRQNHLLASQLIEGNRSRDMLGAVIDNIDDALTVKDRDGRYLLFNRSAAQRAGVRAADVLGTDDSHTLSPEQFQRERLSDQRLMETRQAETCETQVTSASETRNYLTTRTPLIRRNGLVGGVIAISRDITDRVRALDAIQRNEERFRKLVENAWDASVVVDRHGKITYATQSIERILGFQPADLIGRQGLDFIHVDDRARIVKELAILAVRPDERHRIQHRADLPDGVHWLEMVLTNLLSDPDIRGIVINVRDVTSQHQAEIDLRESQARLQAIFDSEPECVKLIDADCRLLDINLAGLRILEADSIDQVRFHSALDIVSVEHREHFQRSVREVFAGQSTRIEFEIVGLAGTRRWMEQYAVGLKDPHDPTRVVQMLAVARDITDRRRTELELAQARVKAEAANRAKSEFLANMSHEIRTPLTAILGFANLLVEETSEPIAAERRTEAIETIRQAGEHLLTVVNDILDLSKIEAGQLAVESIETSFVELIRGIDCLVRPHALAKGLWLRMICETPVPGCMLTDPTRLRQILMNLLGNAIKFTERGGVTLRFSAVPNNERTVLQMSIEDTGIGMSPGQAERLFAAFAQGDSTVTRKYGGTGLGLVICKRLAELLGGDVKLVRTQAGLGSIFKASVVIETTPGSPLIQDLNSVTTVAEPRQPAPKFGLQGRILLAEDARENQVLISYLLRRAGADVDIADNGVVALEMIDSAVARGQNYDLLLTDMQMPEMDGYTLARQLRSRGSSMPIIALTAHAMSEDRKKCTDAGCDDYASKPIDKSLLLSICAQWIGQTTSYSPT